MILCRLGIVCSTLLAIGASSALAADADAPASVKMPAHVAKTKPKAKAAAHADRLPDSGLPEPSAPLVGAAKSSTPVFPPATKGALAEPDGGLSLGLKWHATNDPVDRFDAVRHTSGPNGPGEGVEAGVRIGF